MPPWYRDGEKTEAEQEVEYLTDQEKDVLYHKAVEMQSSLMAKNGTLPLEMGVFTDSHFVIVYNVDLGNISAVRAFDIEKNTSEIWDEINIIISNEGDKISDNTRSIVEEARVRLKNSIANTSNTERGNAGVRNAGLGGRQQSERGTDSSLDSGTHLADTAPDIRYRVSEDAAPKKTGVGYKVFVLKNGKLYPPMVANPNGEATPVGVWLDADAAPVAGTTKRWPG